MGFGGMGPPGGGMGFGRGRGDGRFMRGGDHADEERPGARLDIMRLVGYLRPYRRQIAFSLFLSIFGTALTLVPPRLVGLVVDELAGAGSSRTVSLLAAFLLLVYVLTHALEGFKRFVLGRLGLRWFTTSGRMFTRTSSAFPSIFTTPTRRAISWPASPAT